MYQIKKLSTLALAFAASSAFAAAVTPSFDTFGSQPAITFGGSGIPNNAVASTVISNQTGSVQLALSATQRFSSPTVTNNGAGVFHAASGAYVPAPGGDNNFSLWNFDYFVGVTGTPGYSYKLFVDGNRATGNELGDYVLWASSTGSIQDSTNFGWVTDLSQFNPSAAGQYGFYLAAYNALGTEVGHTAILVEVPEPASLALVGIALLGMVGLSRRRS